MSVYPCCLTSSFHQNDISPSPGKLAVCHFTDLFPSANFSESVLLDETKACGVLWENTDQVRQGLRLHHYSIHTERSYVDWIVWMVCDISNFLYDFFFLVDLKISKYGGSMIF
jgi:hypothetical protein